MLNVPLGPYQLQDSSYNTLYQFNAAMKIANSNDFLKVNQAVEVAGGGSTQYFTGDGLPTGGILMLQVREGWNNGDEEAAVLGELQQALLQAAYFVNADSGALCAIRPATEWDVWPVRADRMNGPLLEINVNLTPINRLEAARMLRRTT